MPTKLKRYSVSLPEEIQVLLEKDSTFNRRPVANQIMWILDQWYNKRKEELDYFRPQLHEAKPSESPQFFQTASEPAKASVSKLRAKLGQDNT